MSDFIAKTNFGKTLKVQPNFKQGVFQTTPTFGGSSGSCDEDFSEINEIVAEIQNNVNDISKRVEQLEQNQGGGDGTQPLIVITTYAELKALRDSGKLIVGQQYRITDYVATTSDPETKSANHPFDIIVTADSANILNENARAIQHEGDEYFANSNLAAWKLKYCLDNDKERFEWAQQGEVSYFMDVTTAMGVILDDLTLLSTNDTKYAGYPYKFKSELAGIIYTPTESFSSMTTCKSVGYGNVPVDSLTKIETPDGKGVIYQLIDEHNNDIPYDFKGILVNVGGIFNHLFTNTPQEETAIDCSIYSGNVEDNATITTTIKPKNCKMAFSKSLCKGKSFASSDWECGSGSTKWTSVMCSNWKCGNNCCDWHAQVGLNWVCEHNCSNWYSSGGDFHIFSGTGTIYFSIENTGTSLDKPSKGTLFVAVTSNRNVKMWYPADEV